ncbi:MAG: hypothetical protein OXU23_12685 [Candidatus Poribacteria bacterium]|nr:hypothetical protein [Candidatus Poribacteria bacterium]MDE0466379.1 hypothetical protein [Candidatus Poribacteria bacterium]
MPSLVKIKIAVPRCLFDLVSVWIWDVGVSGPVVIGSVLGVEVVISGAGLRGVGSDVWLTSRISANDFMKGIAYTFYIN